MLGPKLFLHTHCHIRVDYATDPCMQQQLSITSLGCAELSGPERALLKKAALRVQTVLLCARQNHSIPIPPPWDREPFGV